MIQLHLQEYGEAVAAPLSQRQAVALAASGLVTVTPTEGEGRWAVRASSSVGVAVVRDVELWITPKTPIRRLFFLMGFTDKPVGWRSEDVTVAEDAELLPAIAGAFVRQAERAVELGLLQGYRVHEEASPVLRGRVRSDEQLRRRFGLPIPLEVRYDEFTVDIAENRLLRAATERLLRLPGVDQASRRRLRRLLRTLADVSGLPRGVRLPDWQPTRLNARYHVALQLARIILTGGSVEQTEGRVRINGFVLNVAALFEDFVTATLGHALADLAGGHCRPQDTNALDISGDLTIRPDLVWYDDRGRPRGVMDVKYKLEKPSGYPNADVYQMLTYCSRLGLPEGHLVYARGEAQPRVHELIGSGVTIFQHAVDLEQEPAALLAQMTALAYEVAARVVSPLPAAEVG